jgi:hypothetical protein
MPCHGSPISCNCCTGGEHDWNIMSLYSRELIHFPFWEVVSQDNFVKEWTKISYRMTVFWDVAPCSLIEIEWYFRDACCLYHKGDEWNLTKITQYSVFYTCKVRSRGFFALQKIFLL